MGIKKEILKETKKISSDLEIFANEAQFKIKKYEEIQSLLNDIRIKVENVYLKLDENGSYCVEIRYNIPNLRVTFDDKDNVVENKMFKAINMLNLISFDDMNKIRAKIEEARIKNIKSR